MTRVLTTSVVVVAAGMETTTGPWPKLSLGIAFLVELGILEVPEGVSVDAVSVHPQSVIVSTVDSETVKVEPRVVRMVGVGTVAVMVVPKLPLDEAEA